MSDPKFTKGPYLYGPDFDEMEGDYILKEIDENLQSIGEAFDRCPVTGLSIPPEERVANAKLFAAAPDLYAELEKALNVLSAYAELIGRASPGWEDIHHAMILCGEQTVFDDTLRVISDGKTALATARGR